MSVESDLPLAGNQTDDLHSTIAWTYNGTTWRAVAMSIRHDEPNFLLRGHQAGDSIMVLAESTECELRATSEGPGSQVLSARLARGDQLRIELMPPCAGTVLVQG